MNQRLFQICMGMTYMCRVKGDEGVNVLFESPEGDDLRWIQSKGDVD